MDGEREDSTTVTQNESPQILGLLERANQSLEEAVKRIETLEKRIADADLEARVQTLEDAKWEEALDEAIELNAEAITAKGLNGSDFGGRDGKWEVMTLTDNPCLVGTGDRDLADALNDGWEIVHIGFAQSSWREHGMQVTNHTRCVTLKRFVLDQPVTPEPKREAKEASLSEPEAEPESAGVEETVIEVESEPVRVLVSLGENMTVLGEDGRPYVGFPGGKRHLSYEDAVGDPDLDAEHLESIAEREASEQVSETLRKFRAGEITFEEACAGAGRRDAHRAKWDMEVQAVKDRFVANAEAIQQQWKRPAPWAQGV